MNKKNIIFGVLLLLFTHITYAQKVGINTDNPQTTLDVNGAIQVRKDIKLGSAAGTAGSSGAAGYGFTSQGAGKSPVWSPMGLDISLGFGITQSVVLADSVGMEHSSTTPITSLTAEYLEDSELTVANGWTELSNLKAEVRPTKTRNRLVITLQTAGQVGTMRTMDAVFAIGIFLDGKLKSVRPLPLYGDDLFFAIGTLFDSFENLPLKANNEPYVIQVAAAIRYKTVENATDNSDWVAILGKTITKTNNTNNLMNMTTLKMELYEDMME